MFVALRVYQIKLEHPDINLNKLKKVKSLFNFKKDLIKFNKMSKKKIDKLIEKNWSYTNYEQIY